MEIITPQMIVLAILGIIIHIGMKINQRSNKANEKFSIKKWLTDSMNLWRLFLSIASTAAILLMSEDIAAYFGLSVEGHGNLMNIIAFGAGYSNHSFIRNLLKIFKRQSNNIADNESNNAG